MQLNHLSKLAKESSKEAKGDELYEVMTPAFCDGFEVLIPNVLKKIAE